MTAPFRFKQFTVQQDRCAMKVGTDAILLGAWANGDSPRTILDIGTGSGVIALMLAQRFPAASVHAVDVDEAACVQSSSNFAASPWCDRLQLTRAAIQTFEPVQSLDLIACNPPYFHSSLKSPDESRNAARHNDRLSLEDLANAVTRLLSPGGHFSLILPIERAERFREIAERHQLICTRACLVRPMPHLPPKRELLEFSNQQPTARNVTEELCVEIARHQYSEEYSRLARDFLLKLR